MCGLVRKEELLTLLPNNYHFKRTYMNNITVEELKARMDAGEKVNLIDCREPDE